MKIQWALEGRRYSSCVDIVRADKNHTNGRESSSDICEEMTNHKDNAHFMSLGLALMVSTPFDVALMDTKNV